MHEKWRNVFSLSLLLFLLVGCAEKKPAANAATSATKPPAPSKIHPKISEFLRNLADTGSRTDTKFIKMNAAGKIQVYVHVSAINQENLQSLKQCDVDIELQNEKLLLIQAWIPSDQFDNVAKLPFVTKITPPSYGHI